MEPSKKSEGLEQDMAAMFGFDRRVNIQADCCCPPPIGCGKPATEFKDELSRREFAISGLCQACQDKIFGEDGEGSKTWTLESALPFLRELEAACNPWGYFTALAGSVLYKGWSDNDLDIHLYLDDPKKHVGHRQAALDWFQERGWLLQPCAKYPSGFAIYAAQQDGRVINLFFMRKDYL